MTQTCFDTVVMKTSHVHGINCGDAPRHNAHMDLSET